MIRDPRSMVRPRLREPEHIPLELPPLYDWAQDRDAPTVAVNRTVARYCLEQMAKVQSPAHPQAHADAIRHLRQVVNQ